MIIYINVPSIHKNLNAIWFNCKISMILYFNFTIICPQINCPFI